MTTTQKTIVLFLLITIIMIPHRSPAQEAYTVSGYIRDHKSGEDLIGATVRVKELNKGTSTNQYGFYSLTLKKGSYTLISSYLGYKTHTKKVQLSKDLRINQELEPKSIVTGEVVVKGKKPGDNLKNTDISTVEMDVEKVKTLPVLLGEADVLKTLQLLPGIQSGGEGNSGLYIRGGGPAQNLILLDEAVVYNTGHLFGFFSVFNPDALKNTRVIKGGMPANYGGRLSSVVDISMKEGNNKKYNVQGGLGFISSRLTVEGPLKKNKSSFMISARRTYVDQFLQPFTKNTDFEGNSYFFYDLNTKFNYSISDKDRLYLSGYLGRDVFQYQSPTGNFSVRMPWGNRTATIRWNHLFSDKLFMNATAIFNDYNFEVDLTQENWDFTLYSGIRDYKLKTDFTYFPTINHQVKFGGSYTYHTFIPSTATGQSTEGITINTDSVNKKYGNEAALYLLDRFDISDRLRVNAGLRISAFQQLGPYLYYGNDNTYDPEKDLYEKGESVTTYYGLEPRLNMRFKLNRKSALKASITRNKQYIHLVSYSNTTLPADMWMPSTKKVKPETGMQYALGYFRNFRENTIETSIEMYYRNMHNQIEFGNGYIPEIGRQLERDFVFGTGEALGVELFVNKKFGNLTGWIGYTLSRSLRIFNELRTPVFPYKYDRRHDLSVVASYRLNKRWTFSSTFVYTTGIATTVPERWYITGGSLNNYYGDRNGYRLPPYNRLDISAKLKGKENKKFQSDWIFAVYNVYNRKNPFFIYFETEGSIYEGNLDIIPKQVSLFPIIPSVTWNYKF